MPTASTASITFHLFFDPIAASPLFDQILNWITHNFGVHRPFLKFFLMLFVICSPSLFPQPFLRLQSLTIFLVRQSVGGGMCGHCWYNPCFCGLKFASRFSIMLNCLNCYSLDFYLCHYSHERHIGVVTLNPV
ncbi:hypothetical protein ABFS83_06G137400 [Erythranthe nasuta]